MLGRLRLLAVCVAVAVGIIVATASAAVADDGWGGVDCTQHPTDPQCVVTVVTGGSTSAGSASARTSCLDFVGTPAPCYIEERGWNGGDGCYYKAASPEFAAAFGEPTPPAAWYEGWCGDTTNGEAIVVRMRIFAAAPGQTLLVDEAVRQLNLRAPTIHLNPPPPAAQLVHLPTWLWVDAPAWSARSATASVPGLSVTATATPVTMVWSTGDGATVTCQGPGTPWRPGNDPAAPSPDCGHTYDSPSTPGSYTLRATVTWSVAWAGGVLTGNEPALTSTATTDVRVQQSAVVNAQAGA
jgi:hypothetical protein